MLANGKWDLIRQAKEASSQDSEKQLSASSCLSVRPSVRTAATTGLQLDGFSWDFVFEYFHEMCRENSRLVRIGQE